MNKYSTDNGNVKSKRMSEWKTVRLGDVCEKGSSNIAQNEIADNNGEYPIYGAAGFIKNVDFYKQDKPYIGIVKDGAGVGRVSIHPAKSSLIGTMQYIFPKENIDIKFLAEFLKYQNLSRFYTGATIPHIYFKDYQNIPLKLPSLQKQKHISAVLGKCTELIVKNKTILEKYDTLIKSRFIEMFGEPHNNTKYPYKTVGDFTTVTSGGTPDRKNTEYWKNGNIPWVKTTELQNNELTEVEEFITKKGLDESSAKMMPIGTLLIAMYGQGKTRGMTAYLGIEASTNQACACILPSEEINQKYLWYYFILSYDKLRDLAKGGNQPNLNGNMIKNFPVLMPPIEMQNEYVSFVQQIDKSKFAVQKSLNKAETLYKSLMQEYFG